jgi:hypothetical protein
MTDGLHAELTEQIIGCAIEVHRLTCESQVCELASC